MHAYMTKTFRVEDDNNYHYMVEIDEVGCVRLSYIEPEHPEMKTAISMSPDVAKLVAKALQEIAVEA